MSAAHATIDLDDVEGLRGFVQQRSAELGRPLTGAVIGGGLLGLEAAEGRPSVPSGGSGSAGSVGTCQVLHQRHLPGRRN